MGLFSYENWIAFLNNEPSEVGFEYPLFTDVHITGEIVEDLGPYRLFNTIYITQQKAIVPKIILRVDYHKHYETPSMDKTDVKQYHGGDLTDEIASLISLFCGFRCKAGGELRIFKKGKDPRGTPRYLYSEKNPINVSNDTFRKTIPSSYGDHSIMNALMMNKITELSENEATAFIKSARSYQEGLWLSESSPENTWIHFVSAIETLAFWSNEKIEPVEKLRASKPELEKVLLERGGNAHVKDVAEIIAPYMGATMMFVDFMLEFMPAAPQRRPYEWMQIEWSHQSLRKNLKKVYDWRSRALHGGTPFPAPMCENPHFQNGAFAEKPIGLASASQGGVWVAKDVPINLHAFEYMVRNVLVNWYKSKYEK